MSIREDFKFVLALGAGGYVYSKINTEKALDYYLDFTMKVDKEMNSMNSPKESSEGGPLSGLVKSATNAIDNVNSALQREAFKVEAREKMEEFDAKYPVKSETVVKLVAGIITYRLIKSGLDVLLR